MAVPPPGGSNKERRDREGEDIGPPETEYGRAFVATRPILALCEGTERRGRARVHQRWWEQTGIDWRLARAKSESAEAAGERTATETAGTTTTTPETELSDSEKGLGEEESLGARLHFTPEFLSNSGVNRICFIGLNTF